MDAISRQSRTLLLKNKAACKRYRYSEIKFKIIAAGMVVILNMFISNEGYIY
jgi:hypothetical protein